MPIDILSLEFLFLAAVTVIGGVMRGYSGFGSAMVISPLWALAIDPIAAVPALIIMELLVSAQLLPRAVRSTDWRLIGLLTVAAAVTIPVGTYLLTTLDPVIVRRVIGLVVFVWALVMLRGMRYAGQLRTSATLGIGATSGVLMGATSLGGPPVLMYLLSTPARAESNRANIITFFGLVSVFMIAVYAAEGLYNETTLWRAGLLTPVFLISAWVGATMFDRSSEATFRRIALLFLLAVGVMTLAGWDIVRAVLGV